MTAQKHPERAPVLAVESSRSSPERTSPLTVPQPTPAAPRETRATMTLEQYRAVLAERFGDDPKLWRVVCPSCGTVQSLQNFFDAAHPATAEEKDALARMVGFSCIGRVTGAKGAFNREKFAPCNYSSGGLFRINSLTVIGEDGKEIPAFEPAPAPESSHV